MSAFTITRKIKVVCLDCGQEVYAQLQDGLLEVDRCRICVDKRVRHILKERRGGEKEAVLIIDSQTRFKIDEAKERELRQLWATCDNLTEGGGERIVLPINYGEVEAKECKRIENKMKED